MSVTKKYCLNCFAVMAADLDLCPQCGHVQPQEYNPLYLKPPFRLNRQYIIGKVLGHGGFGITYLGFDRHLNTRVAIKEYFPSEFASRAPDGQQVIPYSGEKSELFRLGREKFIAEARLLASLRSPNIVRIRHFFEECNTAYFIMEYLEGHTLTEYVRQNQGKLSVEQVKKFLMPLLEALEEVHAKNSFHRDIKPDNIYITTQGQPILLDFGAARQQLSGATTNLMAFLTPGFAPAEQYSTNGIQGPWTDIYALAATLYFSLTGQIPPTPQDRLMGDAELIPPSQLGVNISPQDEAWLLKGLEIKWSQRPESIAQWRQMIESAAAKVISSPPHRSLEEENFMRIAILPRLTSRFLTPQAEQDIHESASFMDISRERVQMLIEEALLMTGSTRWDPEAEKRQAQERQAQFQADLQRQEQQRENKGTPQPAAAAHHMAESQQSAKGNPTAYRPVHTAQPSREELSSSPQARVTPQTHASQHSSQRTFGAGQSTTQESEKPAQKRSTPLAARVNLSHSVPAHKVAMPPPPPPPPTPDVPADAIVKIPARLTNLMGMDFVLIQPQPEPFSMGKPDSGYQVLLTRPYYLQTTPVTQGQWRMVMGINPAYFQGDEWRPVEQVSWDDCQIFIQRLNSLKEGVYRLPTEAEWEFACRSGKTCAYSFGDNESELEDYAWFDQNAENCTHPVGMKKSNEWGLFDMHGNVWEWVYDRYAPYPRGVFTDPRGPESGLSRIMRGGSWNLGASYCRADSRNYEISSYRFQNLGFRLLLEVK